MWLRIAAAWFSIGPILSSGVLSTAIAQNRLPVLQLATGSYSESFSTSGTRTPPGDLTRVVIGLYLGRSNGPFRIDQIGVSLPRNLPANDFCIRISSGDSRYQAMNMYRKAADRNALPLVQTKSSYARALAQRYTSAEMAVKIVETNKCTLDANGPLVPAIPPGATARDVLVAFVNVTGSPAAAHLYDKDKIVAEGECAKPVSNDVILYSDVCKLLLEQLGTARPDRLQVKFFDQTAKRAEVAYQLVWPEPGP